MADPTPLSPQAQSVVDFMNANPFPEDRRFGERELVLAVVAAGFPEATALGAIGECYAKGRIRQGPRVRDGDAPWYRLAR